MKVGIGKIWVSENKKDERGIVIRNKARLVAQGHRQEEGIDYGRSIDPVARIEGNKIGFWPMLFLWVFGISKGCKGGFLYGTIEDRSLCYSTPGFKDTNISQSLNRWLSQDKYLAEILKKFNYSDVKSASTPVDLEKPLVRWRKLDVLMYIL
ncbi:putative ribonuclease H-like domain-containing protein [Tanacetum coccineum]|uniref:Ribonuclease H-like domain-containing protein n=1 Tax=Tanacetum coccineum TaxID=301880 RepID=A0ABQ5CHN7_9ASTR